MPTARCTAVLALTITACTRAPVPHAARAASAQRASVTARPYVRFVPAHTDPSHPIPLLVVLHGYGGDGASMVSFLHLDSLATRSNILVAVPSGTPDHAGRRFWNATPGCCDFDHANPDDVAYLRDVIDDVRDHFAVDSRRVFVVGHSNGGFMAYRVACELGDRVTAIASLAGAGEDDPQRCTPSHPVSVLQIHGTRDDRIDMNGGAFATGAHYPPIAQTLARWVTVDGCGALAPTDERFDLDARTPGDETHVSRANGCQHGAVELWTMDGAGHFPDVGAAFENRVLAWLAGHPR